MAVKHNHWLEILFLIPRTEVRGCKLFQYTMNNHFSLQSPQPLTSVRGSDELPLPPSFYRFDNFIGLCRENSSPKPLLSTA